MPSTDVLSLSLPRTVDGAVGRSRTRERVAVLDRAPVAVASADPTEAPIAFRTVVGQRPARAYRGRLYVRLGEGKATPTEAWESTVRRDRTGIEALLGAPSSAPPPGFLAFGPWAEALSGAARRRGFPDAGAVRFGEVADDGAGRLAADALRLGDRLLLVGRELWCRIGLPRYEVDVGPRDVRWRVRIDPLPWASDADGLAAWDGASFRIDRAASALELAAASHAPGRPHDPHAYRPTARIDDPDLLAACYDAVADEDTLAMLGIAATVAEAMRPRLGDLPLGIVRRWVGLRESALARDLPALRGWMDGAAECRDAVAAAGMRAGAAGEERTPLDRLDAAILRYEAVDRPRMNLVRDGDAAALAAA